MGTAATTSHGTRLPGAIVHCQCHGYGAAGDHQHRVTVTTSPVILTKGMDAPLRTVDTATRFAAAGMARGSGEPGSSREPSGLSLSGPLHLSFSQPSLSKLCTLLL